MGRKVGMVHAVYDNGRLFGQLATELVPGVEVVHFVDGGLPAMSAESLRPRVITRLRALVSAATESGAEAILLTCTAFGRLVDEVKVAASCPVLAVLEIMIDEALQLHGTVGIVSSHPATLTFARVLQEQASLEGRTIDIKTRACSGAFEAMQRGDRATHDRIVHENLREFVKQVDVVVAPQPSIESAMQEFARLNRTVPVLTSPRLSILRLKETLHSLA
ncbi:MAG: aspartate/glutamate racemase family protein [Dehalococcoidia bacterium]|jgi:Asp/Glu/hydantoin racemase|nr:aspartate/glutamate racemase family protein [Dehalococcoidia bacterium]